MSERICSKCGAWKTVCNCVPEQVGMSSQEVISNREVAEAVELLPCPDGTPICKVHGPRYETYCTICRDTLIKPPSATTLQIAERAAREIAAYIAKQVGHILPPTARLDDDECLGDFAAIITTALDTREREVVERCAVVAEAYGKGQIFTAENAGFAIAVKDRIAAAIRATVRDDQKQNPR